MILWQLGFRDADANEVIIPWHQLPTVHEIPIYELNALCKTSSVRKNAVDVLVSNYDVTTPINMVGVILLIILRAAYTASDLDEGFHGYNNYSRR